MTFRSQLDACVEQNNSLVCVGLDCDQTKLPAHLQGQDRVFDFAKEIIDKTADAVCAYKLNSAFFEATGADGIAQLKKICDYLNNSYPAIPIILDAKRADIGNTNLGYAAYAFDYLQTDALTVSPYLGAEALEPLLRYADRGIIVLCRTSNVGAAEFQDLPVGDKKLYQVVAERVRDSWNESGNCALVVGAQHVSELSELRVAMGDDMLFLIPGVGAQGNEAAPIVTAGLNSKGNGIMINSSRGIIFASSGTDFAEAARTETLALRDEINKVRSNS